MEDILSRTWNAAAAMPSPLQALRGNRFDGDRLRERRWRCRAAAVAALSVPIALSPLRRGDAWQGMAAVPTLMP